MPPSVAFADPTDLEDLYSEVDQRTLFYRSSARDLIASGRSSLAALSRRDSNTALTGPYNTTVGGYATSAGYANTGEGMFAAAVANLGGLFAGYDDIEHAVRQYAAFRDIPYTAIRPITVKIADQPIHMGRFSRAPSAGRDGLLMKDGSLTAGQQRSIAVIKELAAAGIDSSNTELFLKIFGQVNALGDFEQQQVIETAPSFVQKAYRKYASKALNSLGGGGIEIIPHHPVIEAIENPNDYFTQWALIWCTMVSIIITGRSFWWIDTSGDDGRDISIWYIPSSWVRPVHTRERAFDSWIVRPVNTAAWMPVAREDMVPFYVWNPANPTTMFSPMQSQSYAISTDEEMQRAQYHSMKNITKPGMILTMGRVQLPAGYTGQGPRLVATPEQRTQLTQAVRLAYRGAMHMGDPLILDGLVEKAEPWMANPVDLDFPEGSKLTRKRITMGFGVNDFMMGESEGSNRATAYVASEQFYENAVNPYITFLSQMLTKYLAPRFVRAGEKLYMWLEKARPHDEDLTMGKLKLLADNEAVTKNELRKFADFAPRSDCEELVPPKKPTMGTGAGGEGAGGSGAAGPGGASGKTNPSTTAGQNADSRGARKPKPAPAPGNKNKGPAAVPGATAKRATKARRPGRVPTRVQEGAAASP